MSSSSTKKKHLKRKQDALLRSQTVRHNKPGVTIDEFQSFQKAIDTRIYEIRLVDPPDTDELMVACTCGWSFGPDPSNLRLGREAINHSNDTRHVLRGREN